MNLLALNKNNPPKNAPKNQKNEARKQISLPNSPKTKLAIRVKNK